MARLLIVDDSTVNLKVISRLLGDLYEVITACDGRTAIQLATEKMPDLILLDVLMPEMDGLTVCRILKNQALTAEIPIIFITVVSESNNIVQGFEAGGQDYITKPFGSQELCARIKTHLELKESKEALKTYAKQLEAKNQELKESKQALKVYAKQLEAKNLELKLTLASLEVMATTDYLTNLPNRRFMMQRINDEVARLKRKPGNMALILADIDEFKKINDTYGHNFGDSVVKAVADALRANTREQDVISRWGGDEYLLMLPDTDLTGARIVAGKILAAMESAAIRYQGKEIPVTVTLGVAVYDLTLDIDANVKKADESLYAGKNLDH